jgi:RNA polymerase sigma factor (sigma-70 family)
MHVLGPTMTDAMKTDESLLREFLAGNRSAFGELAARHETSLLGLARGLLGGRTDLACDAVQESWVRVLRFAGSFDGRSTFKTWIYRIVVNQCHNIRAINQGTLSPAREPVSGNDSHAGSSDPRAAAAATERNGALHAAVDRLGDDKRSILLLCYHAGLTHEDTAQILALPLGTLKSRLHAALIELRQTLAAEAAHDR